MKTHPPETVGVIRPILATAALIAAALLPAWAGDAASPKLPGPQLDPSGKWLVVPDVRAGTLSVQWANASVASQSTRTKSFALSADQPYSLSADASVLAGLEKSRSGNASDLVVFNVNTSTKIGAVTLSSIDQPDSVWVNARGTSAGVFSLGRFIAFDLAAKPFDPKPKFERPASFFLASPSGKLVVMTSNDGDLQVFDSEHWQELTAAQTSIQRTVQKWLTSRHMRPANPNQGGPFIFPVTPVAITSDDRLMSVSLGENANIFLNLCISSGELVSSVVLDKRVNATMKYGTSGSVFAIQVVPNSDDPAFKRPESDYGLRIYDNYSGKLLSTVPISSSDWVSYGKVGTKYFEDDWSGWLGFTAGDKAVLSIDAASQKTRLQQLRQRPSGSDVQLQKSCPAPG